jgi:hypothetical protein
MTPRQIVFVTAVALALTILVLELIRRHMLRERYSLLWFFICVALLTMPWLYDGYLWVAHRVGIKDPNSIFYFLAIMGLVLLSLQFSLALSTAYYQRKQLIQQVALLENRVRQLEGAAKACGEAPPAGGREAEGTRQG